MPTLKQYYAAKALQGMLANNECIMELLKEVGSMNDLAVMSLAVQSFKFANAMIEAEHKAESN